MLIEFHIGNDDNVKPAQENHSGTDTSRFPLNQGAQRPFKVISLILFDLYPI